MKKLIRLAPHITAAIFGCGEEYFNTNIKNKVLDVESEMKHVMFVKDDNNETWTVFKEDVIEVDVAGKPVFSPSPEGEGRGEVINQTAI